MKYKPLKIWQLAKFINFVVDKNYETIEFRYDY